MSRLLTPHSDPQALAVEIARLAYEASSPMGMGFLHAQPGPISPALLASFHDRVRASPRLHLGYVQGRTVKLQIVRTDAGVELFDDTPTPDYQSWCFTYPTYQALADAAVASLASQPQKVTP